MKAAANLTLLYGHLPLEERFSAAKADGFSAVEILFPYDQTPHWYAERLSEHGLQLILVNTPIDEQTARWGRAAVPGQAAQFREDFSRAAELCELTGCTAVHVMAGCVPEQQAAAAREVLIANLQWASAQALGLVLQLEALNSIDVPGYFYSRPADVRSVLEDSAVAAAGMQFDFYHVLREGLNVETELDAALPWLRHVQVAGTPARQEPDLLRDTGYLAGFARLHEASYQGYVGFEYRPAGFVSEGLAWATQLSSYFSHLPTASGR